MFYMWSDYMAYTKLSDAQKKKLGEHSKHHTKKHITEMRASMRKGKSFTQAHMEAKKKVGNGKK